MNVKKLSINVIQTCVFESLIVLLVLPYSIKPQLMWKNLFIGRSKICRLKNPDIIVLKEIAFVSIADNGFYSIPDNCIFLLKNQLF